MSLPTCRTAVPSQKISVLLVTPGFVTDIFGLSLLVPSVRAAIANQVQKHIKVNQFGAGASFHHGEPGNVYQHDNTAEPFTASKASSNKPISHHQGDTLEGEFKRKD